MEKIFEQYGGVIVTVIAIMALIGIVTYLTKSSSSPLTSKIIESINKLFDEGQKAITVTNW